MLDTNSANATIFDQEIAERERLQRELENEKEQILQGQYAVVLQDGHTVNIDLGRIAVGVATSQGQAEKLLAQTLAENPIVQEIANSFRTIQEIKEELKATGDITSGDQPNPTQKDKQPRGKTPKIVAANARFNFAAKRRNRLLGALLSSSWLLLIGLAVILYFFANPFLNIFFNSNNDQPANTPLLAPATTIPGSTFLPTVTIPTASALVKNVEYKYKNTADSSTGLAIMSIAYYPNREAQVETIPATATASVTPTATSQVGQPSTDAGGLNGPHGAFSPPASLASEVSNINTPIERAVMQVSGSGNEGATASNLTSLVTWPRPNHVLHMGAYPGEIGNMVLMGNQQPLSGLRLLDTNDTITVTDRAKNQFVYRVIALSQNGQPERVVNLAVDSWLFDTSNYATLTIITTLPQPQSAVAAVPAQTTPGADNDPPSRDDFLNPNKLAYRAVLAYWIPSQGGPAGTPVAVPQSAWSVPPQQPQIASTITTPTPTPTPTPAPITPAPTLDPTKGGGDNNLGNLPGLPDTGLGGASWSAPQWCAPRFTTCDVSN